MSHKLKDLVINDVAPWVLREARKRSSPYSAGKLMLIEAVEQAFRHYRYTGDFNKIYRALRPTVKRIANEKSAMWREWRMDASDFESCMWEKIIEVSDEYNWYYSEYFVYETMKLAMDRACLNLIRQRTGKQTKDGNQDQFESQARPLLKRSDQIPDECNVESSVVNRCLVIQILGDERLSTDERRLLWVIYHMPGGSLREWASEVGRNHEWVRRTLRRIRGKLSDYVDCIA